MTPSTPAPQDSPRSSSENSSHDKTPSSRLSDTIATLRNRRRKRKNSNGRLSETERAIQRARQLETTGTQDQATDTDVLRSSGSMAIATLMSRITGFIKNVLLGASLGSAVFSSFNSANQLPNLITEIVLGAVLTSLVVPVLVRAEKEDADHGAGFIRRLITVAGVLLLVVTIICVFAAPLLTRLSLNDAGQVNVAQATNFAYLVLPQIFFYGFSALLMAILNTKGVFKPGAWAPVWNNLVVLAVVTTYWLVPGGLAPGDDGGLTNFHMLLLGLGTTFGVVVQAAVLVPPLRKIGIDLRPEWGIDNRLKELGGMGIAIIVYVAISQAGYFVTNNLASLADSAAPGVYSQAWLLLQMPYGIIGVTLLTAIMPRLSRNAADNNTAGVVRDLTVGTKLTMIGILPIVVFFIIFGPQIGVALFNWGDYGYRAAFSIGLTLSLSAFTLIPYSLVLLHLRVFYAREEAWTPTFIIIAITATKIALSYISLQLAPTPEAVVVLLGMSNGFGFLAGAFIGAFLLKRSIKNLNGREIVRTCLWVGGAAIIAVIVASLVDYIPPIHNLYDTLGTPGMVIRVAIAGIILVVLTLLLLSRSPLPELASLERLLGRMPGPAGRYFMSRAEQRPTSDATATDEATIRPDDLPSSASSEQRDVADQVADALSDGASSSATMLNPVGSTVKVSYLVPDAGRLLPGAYVGDGRYRLISFEGKDDRGNVKWLAFDTYSPDGQKQVTLLAAADKVSVEASPDDPAVSAELVEPSPTPAPAPTVDAAAKPRRATALAFLGVSIASVILTTFLGTAIFRGMQEPLYNLEDLRPAATQVVETAQ